MAIAPIQGMLRKHLFIHLTTAMGIGLASGYGFWYGFHKRNGELSPSLPILERILSDPVLTDFLITFLFAPEPPFPQLIDLTVTIRDRYYLELAEKRKAKGM